MSEQPTGIKLRLQMALGKALFAVYKLKMRFSKKPETPAAEHQPSTDSSAEALASEKRAAEQATAAEVPPPVEPGAPNFTARPE